MPWVLFLQKLNHHLIVVFKMYRCKIVDASGPIDITRQASRIIRVIPIEKDRNLWSASLVHPRPVKVDQVESPVFCEQRVGFSKVVENISIAMQVPQYVLQLFFGIFSTG
jgi:hypothetical protein